ncbi:MAG TPA: carboxypeptidase regulatory-like domain-containing protein [Candidatus Binatia bacterium]|nr:carboxypeptidase regulatory-like domain-containing protein [Candidatus Binatia bacterium]
MRLKTLSSQLFLIAVLTLSSLLLAVNAIAQETTGGLQGTIKDSSGAVVPKASLVLTGTSLGGEKTLETDNSGYYRFANLPPGTYTLIVKAAGFSELKREDILIEVGHLPTLDLNLAVGAAGTVVEVTAESPAIDVTTNTNQTNLTTDVLNETPHGYSFQSVIQFAPMARQEPLAGGNATMGAGGQGGSLPGSAGNGLGFGFSVGGAADSENSYLVEGQDTENISGGASSANVPFQFIQEVQIKSSGIEAEHGGALGGVVNVVMKKGANAFHGSFFGSYEADKLDGSAGSNTRYNPNGSTIADINSSTGLPYPIGTPGFPGFDDSTQFYQPTRDHFSIVQPGFTVGGPIMANRLWFFLGFAPEYNSLARTVNFGPSTFPGNSSLGNQVFNSDNQQYFATARLDATLTQKIRVFGSWLYQYARESGDSLPAPDSTTGLPNTGITVSGTAFGGINSPLSQYAHGLGYSAPNATYITGADITLSAKIVSTTRFGYFFENYHDFGWPTAGVNLAYQTNGLNAAGTGPALDNSGNPLPVNLAVPAGTSTAPYLASFTQINASKHYQFDQDVAFFQSSRWGTHNIKAGYQLNHLSNVIDQHGNLPLSFTYPGAGNYYSPETLTGVSNCSALTAEWGGCAGQYGYVKVQDFATVLKTTSGAYAPAVDWNHALFVQDAWTVGHGLTLNLGLRIEKESLPAPSGLSGPISTINFSWGDKIEPRLGAAWGSRDGKMKIFGSYGVTNDIMKLLLAQTSWGAQGFEWCSYPLGPDGTTSGFQQSDLDFAYNAGGRACPTGIATSGATFANGVVPAALTDKSGTQLIENVNLRPEEPVSPGVKPYRQHEFVIGWDYQIGKEWAFEARYDRRRLDHVIEDASLADPQAGEIYTIVNPGQGVDKTINGYANYLTSIGDAYGPGTHAFNASNDFGTCTGCPNNPVAIRNYDGVELRLTKAPSRGLSGMFSYTWSRLWGNYTGLTTTDQIDGGVTGRNSPDTTRAFDEPFYYFAANGRSSDGPLPTDRPNAFKAYGYYTLPWAGHFKNNTTSFGLFQVAYQGSPMSSFSDIGASIPTGFAPPDPFESVYIFGRGNWVNASTDALGNIIFGTPYARRTPWYTQTDFNLQHAIKVNKNNEHQVMTFNATFTNLLNQRAVTSYWEGFNSGYAGSVLFPGGQSLSGGAAFYQAAETAYNPQATAAADGMLLNSLYGQPWLYQISRHMRLGAQFTW